MTDVWPAAGEWLPRMALGGGGLLLLTWLLAPRTRQPARRQRLAECGLAAALLLAGLCLAPSWLKVELPVDAPANQAAGDPTAQTPTPSRDLTPETGGGNPPADRETVAAPPFSEAGESPTAVKESAPSRKPLPALAGPTTPSPRGTEEAGYAGSRSVLAARVASVTPWGWIVCVYLLGSAYFLGRLALGYWRLARLLRDAEPASAKLRAMVDDVATGMRRPRVLVSRRLHVPLSCGLLRPAVVLPVWLCEAGEEARLRWVLRHELAHLERRDAAACLLFGLGRAVYYFLPWFWWLRHEARLCQEYVADAAAVGESNPAADYAEFLLSWSVAPTAPAGATGVSGHSSDLFRRIRMLVQNPLKVEKRCPRRWSLLTGAGLLSLAVLAAGVGLRAGAAPAPRDVTKEKENDKAKEGDKKEAERKDAEKKGLPALPGPAFPDIEELMKRLPRGLDKGRAELIRKQMEQARRMMEEMRKQMPNAGFPQFQPFQPFGNGFNPFGQQREGRLGVRVDKPTPTLVEQLDLPKGQGLVIQDVVADSAAAKAGLKAHDILLELGGKPVPDEPREFVRMLEDFKADAKLDAVVLRKSKKETLKGVTLPAAKEAARPGAFRFPNFPNLPNVPNVPNVPLPGGFGGQRNSTNATTVTRTNDSFTASNRKGDVSVTVTGKVVGGKAEVKEIVVKEAEAISKYPGLDKTPEEYRATVRGLIKAVEGNKVPRPEKPGVEF